MQLLEDIGLTKSETSVYLALLELGSSTTGKIVDKSGASSSKIYELLDKLMQKGLVSYIVKSRIKHFEAAPPSRIMDYMEERENKFNKQKEELKEIIPQLELKQKLAEHKSEATIYKGIKGVETAFYDSLKLLKKGDEILILGSPARSESIDRFFLRFSKQTLKKDIGMRRIFSAESKEQLQGNIKGVKKKFIPQKTPAAINIFKDRVLIFPETEDKLLISIDSKEVAESFRFQFESLWNQQVQTYEGIEQVKTCYNRVLDELKDEMVIFAAKPVTKDLAEFNVEWNRKVAEKKKNRLIYYGDNNKKRAERIEATGCETKIIPSMQTLPISTVVTGDIVLNSVWSKNPTTFMIKNKAVANSLKTNFELLWNQDTIVVKGFKAFEETWSSLFNELKPGESYNVFGAAFGEKGNEEEFVGYFKELHKRRIAKGIKSKILFQQGAEDVVKKFKMDKLYSKGLEFKMLPFKRKFPVEIYPQGDTTLLLIQKKEPTVITIKNKEVTESFINFFDTLWNQ